MKIRLRIDVDGIYWSGGAIVDVPELKAIAFEPLKSCDRDMPLATGDIPADSPAYRKVIKVREDAAKILSEQLTALIIKEMSKNDTRNGYA